MAEPFLGEVRLFSFAHAPQGWAFCNGQLLPINQNQALFSLLGTTFGGDGRVNFALPDMRGRVPIHVGAGYVAGQRGGAQAHTLNTSEIPTHSHFVTASALTGNSVNPRFGATGHLLARDPGNNYAPGGQNLVALEAASVTSTGGGQAHTNMQPYLTINFCIALTGIFPSPN